MHALVKANCMNKIYIYTYTINGWISVVCEWKHVWSFGAGLAKHISNNLKADDTCIHYPRVDMQPVTGYVNGHRNLEEKHILRIEVAQSHQQTHSPTPVCQHVQHRSKFCGWGEKYTRKSIKMLLWLLKFLLLQTDHQFSDTLCSWVSQN